MNKELKNLRKKTHYFIGLDVHKEFTAYVVRDKDGNILENGECASRGQDIKKILQSYFCSCIIGVETNTEIYPIYNYFKVKNKNIFVANTIQLRKYVGKNDSLDAERLADMLRLGTFPISFIPDGNVKELRGLVKTRHEVMQDTKKKNIRIQAIIRKEGLVMPRKTSEKKWKLKLQEYVMQGKGGHELRHLFEIYDYMEKKLDRLTNDMATFAKLHFPNEYEALTNMPGINLTLAPYFISEISPITRFASEKKLRRYAGVIPSNSESGGKNYGTYLPKHASRGILRWAMVQAAHQVKLHDEKFKKYYNRKKKEKKIHGKAIMAVASSMSDKIYKTLRTVHIAN